MFNFNLKRTQNTLLIDPRKNDVPFPSFRDNRLQMQLKLKSEQKFFCFLGNRYKHICPRLHANDQKQEIKQKTKNKTTRYKSYVLKMKSTGEYGASTIGWLAGGGNP